MTLSDMKRLRFVQRTVFTCSTTGRVRLGLSISCHGAPGFDPLCTFGVLHSTWSASMIVLIGAISALTISVALFIVSLKRRNASLASAGKWSAFTGSKYSASIYMLVHDIMHMDK